jgi:hypothetical protein
VFVLRFNFQTAQPSLRAKAKQSIAWRKERMDCFASLAMTSRHSLAFPRRDAPESWMSLPPIEGAGNTGCALHPRSRVQKCTKKRTRAYRFSGGNPAFPAQWFYGLFRALPGDRAFLPPSPAKVAFRELERQRRGVRTTRLRRPPQARSSTAPSASTASRPAYATIMIRPSVGRDVIDIDLIWGSGKRNIFAKGAGQRVH